MKGKNSLAKKCSESLPDMTSFNGLYGCQIISCLNIFFITGLEWPLGKKHLLLDDASGKLFINWEGFFSTWGNSRLKCTQRIWILNLLANCPNLCMIELSVIHGMGWIKYLSWSFGQIWAYFTFGESVVFWLDVFVFWNTTHFGWAYLAYFDNTTHNTVLGH